MRYSSCCGIWKYDLRQDQWKKIKDSLPGKVGEIEVAQDMITEVL